MIPARTLATYPAAGGAHVTVTSAPDSNTIRLAVTCDTCGTIPHRPGTIRAALFDIAAAVQDVEREALHDAATHAADCTRVPAGTRQEATR